jgi:serine/threonine protein kinase
MSRRLRLARHLSLIGPVGRGGGGAVFIVWNHRAWCPMACKVSGSPRRARREARVLNALDHPNIVRCFGQGRSASAHLLMEYLDGPTLRRVIRGSRHRRLSVANALRLAIHLGAALTHVHERGFVHLDVKPSNVIVVGGRPVLVDFGAARPRTDRPLGYAAGTDPYMAPEQCRGGQVTPASDVFGLGVTLYESLTGRYPFPEGTRRKPFPQLSVSPAPLRPFAPGVPASLEKLILACLAPNPTARPSMAELLPKLHAFIRTGPRMWPDAVESARQRGRRGPTGPVGNRGTRQAA